MLGTPWRTLQRLRELHGDYRHLRVPWIARVKLDNALSRRVRVGFGPPQWNCALGVRGFHIEPIVTELNRQSDTYVADVFEDGDCLERFDVVVIVKHFGSIDWRQIRRLRDHGAVVIYDTADVLEEELAAHAREVREANAVITLSPLRLAEIANDDVRILYNPVINRRSRSRYAHPGPIVILWDGHVENSGFTQRLHPIVEQVGRDAGRDVRLVYFCNAPPRREGVVEWVTWRQDRWAETLTAADIGISYKPQDDPFQMRKPPTKVNNYRAAGLPVVATPSAADREVIEDGVTGFLAFDDDDWYQRLRDLVESAELRRRVGTAGRRYVLDNFSPARNLWCYQSLFDELRARACTV